MLKISKLSKNYGETKALDKVSFDISKGEITGFLGPNGAGKTTALKIMSGFLIPDKGHVSYDGKKLSENSKTITQKIGYLPENNPLYRNMRVDEFLIFNSEFHNDSDLDELEDIVQKCGLESVIDKKIDTLSKGFKQRVGLAKALIGNPDYLLLDEPATGLDPNQKEDILKLIKNLSENKTILFSSHVLSEVTQIADKVIIINKGKIVAQGASDNLVKEHFQNAQIQVKVDANLKEFKAVVSKIKGVSSIEKISKSKRKAISEFKVECSNPEEVAPEIYLQSTKNKWILSELHTQSQGLEDLFKDLTK